MEYYPMIYLVKNLSTTYDLVVLSLSDLPNNEEFEIVSTTEPFELHINPMLFSKITHMPPVLNGFLLVSLFAKITQIPSGVISGLKSATELLKLKVEELYNLNRDEILKQNIDKFIIRVVQLKPDNVRDVLYENSYIGLPQNITEYNKLLNDSPHHHYEILNYSINEFEVIVKKDDAIYKLNQYINNFIIEYKPNVVKKFFNRDEFVEYINNEYLKNDEDTK